MLASERHFIDHLAPVWHALPESVRGRFMVPDGTLFAHAHRHGIAPIRSTRTGDAVMVASYGDLKRSRQQGMSRRVLLEHGAGQSYGGDSRSARHGSYAGGRDHDDVALYLTPNEQAALRWQLAYQTATVAVVGSPKLDTLPDRVPGHGPVVALGFHWPCAIAPEARTAFPHYRAAIPTLRHRFELIGHGHPRYMPRLTNWYRSMGIEPVEDFDDLLRRADLYVCDNSSTLFEFAATGRPVVVLNAPWYRRDVHHGLRFWDAATVGLQVDDPAELAGTIERALADPADVRAERERVIASVFHQPVGGAANAAADAITSWLARRPAEVAA